MAGESRLPKLLAQVKQFYLAYDSGRGIWSMALFPETTVDELRKKLDSEGYAHLSTNQLLVVITGHFNYEFSKMIKLAWYNLVALWAIFAGVVGNIIYSAVSGGGG